MVALARTDDPKNEPNADDLRHRITVEAIRRWEAARELYDVAAIAAAGGSERALDLLEEATRLAVDDAERGVLVAILARDESIAPADLDVAVFEAHRPTAVEFEGRTYVAMSKPGLDPGDDDDGRQVVNLVVIGPDDIVTV